MDSRSFALAAALVCSGSQLPASADAASGDRSLDQMLPKYSRCVAAIMPSESAAFVLSPEELEGKASKATKRPTPARCSYAFNGNEQARFVASWYRDELALALLRQEFSAGGPKTFADRGRLLHPQQPVRGAVRYIYKKMEFDHSRLGECVARSAPEEVRAWIMASADSKGDKPADALDQARRQCSRELQASFMDGQGQASIARGYYRLAHAPSATPVEK